MPDLQLRLTIDDLNLILEAVGNLPFARVYGLVGKLQAQAAEQMQAGQTAAATLPPAAPLGVPPTALR